MYIWPNSEKNEEVVLQRVTEGINILRTMKQMKANWICHILHRNCLLKHIIERKTEATRQGIKDMSSHWMTLRNEKILEIE
jgi:hypothetical protein